MCALEVQDLIVMNSKPFVSLFFFKQAYVSQPDSNLPLGPSLEASAFPRGGG